jgi:hypothetical protein
VFRTGRQLVCWGKEENMRRWSILVLLLVLGLVLIANPATGEDETFEEHPHALVLGVAFDDEGNPISYRKCIDLAAGQALRLNAHHDHMHFGTAGEKLFTNAGNVVVPMAPFPEPFEDAVPWNNCEELIAFFFGE